MVQFLAGETDFTLTKSGRASSLVRLASISVGTKGSFLEVKANYSSSLHAEVKNSWISTVSPPLIPSRQAD